MADLGAFLEQAGRTPFAWGRHDCLLFPSAWLIALGVADPATDFRWRYSTERGALRILNREGGMLALAGRQMAAVGLSAIVVADVCAGDVGIVCTPTPRGRLAHVGAVFTGRLWAVLGVSGLVAAPFRADAAWRPVSDA